MKYGESLHGIHIIKNTYGTYFNNRLQSTAFAMPVSAYIGESGGSGENRWWKFMFPLDPTIVRWLVFSAAAQGFTYYDTINETLSLDCSGTFEVGMIVEDFTETPSYSGPSWSFTLAGTRQVPEEEWYAEANYVASTQFLFDLTSIPSPGKLYGAFIISPPDEYGPYETYAVRFLSTLELDKSFFILGPAGLQALEHKRDNPE